MSLSRTTPRRAPTVFCRPSLAVTDVRDFEAERFLPVSRRMLTLTLRGLNAMVWLPLLSLN